jgi:hypothetical protein
LERIEVFLAGLLADVRLEDAKPVIKMLSLMMIGGTGPEYSEIMECCAGTKCSLSVLSLLILSIQAINSVYANAAFSVEN